MGASVREKEGYVSAGTKGVCRTNTYGSVFSWMGRQHRKQMKLTAAWQMNTTRSASAYESTAACRSSGESVGIMVVECLQGKKKERKKEVQNAIRKKRQ